MKDEFVKIGDSLIQHGKFNNRIYLMKADPKASSRLITKLDKLSEENGYTKIIAKIHADSFPRFLLGGYSIEAYIPEYYNGEADCLMVSKFTSPKRQKIPEIEMKRFRELLRSNQPNGNGQPTQLKEFTPGRLGEKDAQAITGVFKRVFETYPFPVHDAEYIISTMQSDSAQYFGIWDDGKLIGLSTAETDWKDKNAEMTDFAVLPEYRGQKLAFRLLEFMEKEMKDAGIKTAYTVARLRELGMNKTFMNAGYKYTGTLVKNTHIGGSIESMNIFYKKL
ncbi:MAG: putative beta-lysine N-acetyltransferase [Bacteroidota bacterium]